MAIRDFFKNTVWRAFTFFGQFFGIFKRNLCCCCAEEEDAVSYSFGDIEDFANPEDKEQYIRSMQKTIKSHAIHVNHAGCMGR
ncbi:hypothetical protein QR680_016451 [Steinernema hermaphroditum]|uniref:Uncharacterized protein n=1 Tax=Steinernema hermaphroditum TaxID=289476 RepID=A0AA39LMC8_9BILA|nr:hypothetical protein QR680_016451 [Steinernema hermaphroditum]